MEEITTVAVTDSMAILERLDGIYCILYVSVVFVVVYMVARFFYWIVNKFI